MNADLVKHLLGVAQIDTDDGFRVSGNGCFADVAFADASSFDIGDVRGVAPGRQGWIVSPAIVGQDRAYVVAKLSGVTDSKGRSNAVAGSAAAISRKVAAIEGLTPAVYACIFLHARKLSPGDSTLRALDVSQIDQLLQRIPDTDPLKFDTALETIIYLISLSSRLYAAPDLLFHQMLSNSRVPTLDKNRWIIWERASDEPVPEEYGELPDVFFASWYSKLLGDTDRYVRSLKDDLVRKEATLSEKLGLLQTAESGLASAQSQIAAASRTISQLEVSAQSAQRDLDEITQKYLGEKSEREDLQDKNSRLLVQFGEVREQVQFARAAEEKAMQERDAIKIEAADLWARYQGQRSDLEAAVADLQVIAEQSEQRMANVNEALKAQLSAVQAAKTTSEFPDVAEAVERQKAHHEAVSSNHSPLIIALVVTLVFCVFIAGYLLYLTENGDATTVSEWLSKLFSGEEVKTEQGP